MSSCTEAFGMAIRHLPEGGHESIATRFCDAASNPAVTTITNTADNPFDMGGPG